MPSLSESSFESKLSGQPSLSWNPLKVSGWFGHESILSTIPSPSVSGVPLLSEIESGQPSKSWNWL